MRQMDEGAVPDAFVAWFEAFNISFAQLQGRDGGEWRLSSELRFKDFLRALGDMQRKKSVGAGGLAVELLIAAGEQVQFAFYDNDEQRFGPPAPRPFVFDFRVSAWWSVRIEPQFARGPNRTFHKTTFIAATYVRL